MLTARKAGEGQKDFLKSSPEGGLHHQRAALRQAAAATSSRTWRCSYKDIEFAYKAQDDKGGLGGEVKFGWNVATTETR